MPLKPLNPPESRSSPFEASRVRCPTPISPAPPSITRQREGPPGSPINRAESVPPGGIRGGKLTPH